MDWETAAAIASAVAALIALITPFMLARRQNPSSQLDYDVETNIPLLAARPHGVRVVVDGKTMENPRLAIVHIRNVGRKPIRAESYQTPITLSASPGEIMAVDMLEETSEGVTSPGIQLLLGEATLRPDLLNPRDGARFMLIVEGEGAAVTAHCRYEGRGRPMRDVYLDGLARRTLSMLVAACATTLIFLFTSIVGFATPLERSVLGVVFGVSFLLSLILLGTAIIMYRRLTKKGEARIASLGYTTNT